MQDIEQLKLVLEIIGQTTTDAKWVLMAWLGLDFMKSFITSLVFLGIAALFTKVVVLIFHDVLFGKQCRDLVVPNQMGTYVSQKEREKVHQIIKLGLNAEKEIKSRANNPQP